MNGTPDPAFLIDPVAALRAAYDTFLDTVKASLDKRKIPSGDVRVHGSAMHNRTPGDIDVAVIVDAKTFEELGARFKVDAPDAKSRARVDIDLRKSKISSSNFRPDSDPSVATEARRTANELDVQVSVIKTGSEFDVGPYLTR